MFIIISVICHLVHSSRPLSAALNVIHAITYYIYLQTVNLHMRERGERERERREREREESIRRHMADMEEWGDDGHRKSGVRH